MRNALALFVIFIILLSTSCTLKPPRGDKKNKQFPVASFIKILKTIAITECIPNTKCVVGEWTSAGSGISIGMISGGSLIMTAGHVCEVSLNKESEKIIKTYHTTISAINYRNKTSEAKIIKISNGKKDPRDLCMLYAAGLATSETTFASNPPKIGEDVFSMSAPVGLYHPPTVPLLRGIYSGPIEDGNVLVTIPAIGGSSGSGVLNSEMRLVGLIFASARGFNQVSLASNYRGTILFMNEAMKIFLAKPIKSWKATH